MGDKMADPEMGLVISAMHMLPGVLSGCVLAAVLAAICSTADSQLVVAASSAANDIYARLLAKDGSASHMIVNRMVVIAIGIGAVLLELGVRIAAPVIGALIMSNVALGVVSRAVPSLNVLMLAFPVQIALGLTVLGISLPIMASTLEQWPDMYDSLVTWILGAPAVVAQGGR